MVTMHDVLDAQWQMDNAKDGICVNICIITNLVVFCDVIQNHT